VTRDRFSVVRLLGVSVVAVLVFIANPQPSFAAPKQVVVLHSYGQNLKPWSEYSRALRQELETQSRWPVDILDFSVIMARSSNENAQTQLAEYLNALFSREAPDLIVAVGAPAAGFVQRHRSTLFPVTPMVLTAVDLRSVQQDSLTEHDAVVAVRQDISVLFENILQLMPETRTVAVVIGNSPNEKLWADEMRKELEPLGKRINLEFLSNLSFEDMLKHAASLPPNSAIWWNQPHVDATGSVHEGERALRMLYAVANAPIFSYDDSFFGEGIVGGPMTSAVDTARTTAAVVVRLLGGEKPAAIKAPVLQYGPARFDWRQLQRWSISESRLPPGSEVYFRGRSMWESYRWQIALVSAVILVQAALITGLLYERRGRLFAEVQARERMAELARVNRYSTAGELTASIAHELNQPLGSILTNTETAELMVNSPAPDLGELKEILADIRRDDQRASEVIRRLRSLLKNAPFELSEVDLNEVIRDSVSFLAALASAREVELSSSMSPVPLTIKGDRIQLQQVLINVIVNAMDAMSNLPSLERRVTIWTARVDSLAEVSIADTGPGITHDQLKEVFDPFVTTKSDGMGMGLSIARTIVEAHNGRIWADNQTGAGAIFRIVLPLA
jgi:signal transduction histidine kinase